MGLGLRAGHLLLGTGRVVDQVRAGNDLVAFIDQGVSANTRKRMQDTCQTHHCPLYTLPEGLMQGALGRPGAMVAALKPGGIRDKTIALITAQKNQGVAGRK